MATATVGDGFRLVDTGHSDGFPFENAKDKSYEPKKYEYDQFGGEEPREVRTG